MSGGTATKKSDWFKTYIGIGITVATLLFWGKHFLEKKLEQQGNGKTQGVAGIIAGVRRHNAGVMAWHSDKKASATGVASAQKDKARAAAEFQKKGSYRGGYVEADKNGVQAMGSSQNPNGGRTAGSLTVQPDGVQTEATLVMPDGYSTKVNVRVKRR